LPPLLVELVADALIGWPLAGTGLAVDVVVLVLAAGLNASPPGPVADFEEEAARAAALILGFVYVIGCLPFSRCLFVGSGLLEQGGASRLEILPGSPPSLLLHLQTPSSQFVSARRNAVVAVCRAQAFKDVRQMRGVSVKLSHNS
jgi:hypothetical protein